MQNHKGLLNFPTVFTSLALACSLAGAADLSLQAEMNAVLQTDPRNSGAAVSVQYRSNPSVLFYDLRAVAPTNSMADVFRVFLQFAQTEKSREFESVELAFRGQPRFMLSGRYFKQLGEEFGTQNPVYTMRTFPENLLKPDGSRAYQTWTGGLLGVVGKQVEDFNDFHRQWWLGDLTAAAAGGRTDLKTTSAGLSEAPGIPFEPQSQVLAPLSSGEDSPKPAHAAQNTSAQTSNPPDQSVSEPEFAGVFYKLDSGKLIPLEREAATITGKARGFIVMSVKAVLAVPGGRSPVRFRAGEPLDFVVRSRFATSAVDPTAMYWLRKLAAKGDNRELLVTAGHATPVGAFMKTTLTEGVLPVEFARYGSSSYRMTTPALPPGEYAVSRAYSQAVFCFGVDYRSAPSAVSIQTQSAQQIQSAADAISKPVAVRFTSTPNEAEVSIDGEYRGSTPTFELTLPAGIHSIVVKKLGYLPWERKVTLAPGDDPTITAELTPEPNDGTKPRIVGNN